MSRKILLSYKNIPETNNLSKAYVIKALNIYGLKITAALFAWHTPYRGDSETMGQDAAGFKIEKINNHLDLFIAVADGVTGWPHVFGENHKFLISGKFAEEAVKAFLEGISPVKIPRIIYTQKEKDPQNIIGATTLSTVHLKQTKDLYVLNITMSGDSPVIVISKEKGKQFKATVFKPTMKNGYITLRTTDEYILKVHLQDFVALIAITDGIEPALKYIDKDLSIYEPTTWIKLFEQSQSNNQPLQEYITDIVQKEKLTAYKTLKNAKDTFSDDVGYVVVEKGII